MNRNQTSDKLTKQEQKWLTELLLLTGREYVDRQSILDLDSLPRFRTLLSQLQTEKVTRKQWHLVNGLLRCLDIKTMSHTFFKTVFAETNFSDINAVREKIKKLRTVCMLDYGNFKFGYKTLRRHEVLIKEKWSSYFPSPAEEVARARKYQTRPAREEIVQIKPGELFAFLDFGDAAVSSVNSARESLRQIFTEGLERGVDNFAQLRKVKAAKKAGKLSSLMVQAGLPPTPELVDSEPGRERTFPQVLTELLKSCDHIDRNGIERVQEVGKRNAEVYMRMRDLDVYVATSMRTPLHFTTNWAFVNSLFHTEPLRSWNLSYFDPTQTFVQSRPQTGLLEFLMIKRTRLTVYHAQEYDTFGKDCEAGVTLAHGKPVVVFVTRLLDKQPEMKALYEKLDKATNTYRDIYFAELKENGLLTGKEHQKLLLDPGKTQGDAVDLVVRKRVPSILKKIGNDRAEMELIRQGYAPPDDDHELENSVIERIIRLEKRALMFRAHPLALQASPVDGVARGVIVTRTVADTAKVVSGLLSNTMTYEIVDDFEDWVLVDSMTRSPVRVVTKDAELTRAFWSEKWTSNIRYW